MRSLYWKIFTTFWLASTLIIVTTAWVTSELAREASIPAHEKVFMDSYAPAAVSTFEAGQHYALKKWLEKAGNSRELYLYLLDNKGEIFSNKRTTHEIQQISKDMVRGKLNEGQLKVGNIIVSREIRANSGKMYRLAAVSDKPFAHLVQITGAGLTLRVLIAVLISGIICYLLSIYLTKPLQSLSLAAKSIATGRLSTRVGRFKGHYRDEIAKLSQDFDGMAETLEQMVKTKERLLQDISHELRSPLARLQLAIEIGRKKCNTLAQAEFSRMEEECVRLNALIGEILDYARLDKSVYELQRTLTPISAFIQQIVDDANFEFGTVKKRVIFTNTVECSLSIDERLLHRAIENILRNALHYSPPQETVIVSTAFDNAKQNLIISICDHGPGIPEDQLDKIFNPFYRVDKSREKKTGGYGLGLAIAKQAITLHDGEIHLHNCKPQGLNVELILPTSI